MLTVPVKLPDSPRFDKGPGQTGEPSQPGRTLRNVKNRGDTVTNRDSPGMIRHKLWVSGTAPG